MKKIFPLVIAFSLIFSTFVIAGQERPLVMDGGRIKKMAPTDQVDYRNIPTDETTLERDSSGKNVRVKDDGISDAKIDWGSAAEKVNADDMPDGPAKIIPTSTQETNWDNHLSDTSNPHSVTKDQVGLGNVENLKVKLDATAAPTVDDDSGEGYSVGSRWVDITADKEYVCLDTTEGAAVWTETTQSDGGPLDKHDATQAPTANDDSDDGYSVGSHWEDVTNDKAYICLDATVANAIWTETTQPIAGVETNKYDATGAPTVNDDVDLGYEPGSEWVDVTNDKAYVCLDNTDGAAVWTETTAGAAGGEANTASNYGVGGVGVYNDKNGVDLRFKNINSGTDSRLTVTNDAPNREVDIDIVFPQSKLDATTAPTVNDDVDLGYGVGSQWVDVTADKEYVCLDNTDGAAVWVETTAGAAGGEANTASNYGVGGVGVYNDKNGVDLRLKNINAGSAKITVTNDPTNREVDIDASDARADADGGFETIILTAEGAVVGADIVQQVVGASGNIKQYEIEFQDGDTGDDSEVFWSFVMPDNYSATFNSGNCKVTIWYYNEGATPAEVTFAIGWANWADDGAPPANNDVVDWNTTIADTAAQQNFVQKTAETNFNPTWVAGDMVTFGLKRTADTEDDTINFLRLKVEYPVDHVFSGN